MKNLQNIMNFSTRKLHSSWSNLFSIVFLRASGVLVQLIVNIFLARAFGPATIGIYQLYCSWMVTIADGGGMGLPVSTMRRVSQIRERGDKGSAKVLVRSTLLLTASIFLILLAIGTSFIPWLSSIFYQDYGFPAYLQLALTGSLFFALNRILLETRKAEGRPKLAVTIESLGMPLLFLAGGLVYFLNTDAPDPRMVLAIHIGVLVITTVTFLLYWLRSSHPAEQSSVPAATRNVFQPDGFNIWGGVVANVIIMNLPFYLLPLILGPDSIGIFAVSYRIVAVSTTLLVVLSAWFGPRIAAAHARQDSKGVRRELKQARIISTFIYLPFLLICLFFGQHILVIFGEAFSNSKNLLLILAVGQLVNAATGVPGLHLNMIGKSRLELGVALFTILIGTPLCLAGGLNFGITGLAIGYSMTIAIKNFGSLLVSESQINASLQTEACSENISFNLQTQ